VHRAQRNAPSIRDTGGAFRFVQCTLRGRELDRSRGDELIQNITAFGSLIATSVAAFVAVLALFIAKRQIRASREIEALNAYEKHHHLCLQYPELSSGAFEYDRSSPVDQQRYVTFLLSMLLTIERILVLFPKDAGWRAAFRDDFDRHRVFLCSRDFAKYRLTVSSDVIALIDQYLAIPA
jgi:hypothetical protein